jgi:hypothetical protein
VDASRPLSCPTSIASASIIHHRRRTRSVVSTGPSRSRRRGGNSFGLYDNDNDTNDFSLTQLVSARTTTKLPGNPPVSSAPDTLMTPRETVSYADLTLFGKAIAGTVEIAFTVVFEYLMGAMGGYVLGSVTEIPRFLFTPAASDTSLPLWREVSQRWARSHAKSFRWATSWGSISAAFGGFRVAAKVVRDGREDEWTTVLSSMAAGAYFARKGKTTNRW